MDPVRIDQDFAAGRTIVAIAMVNGEPMFFPVLVSAKMLADNMRTAQAAAKKSGAPVQLYGLDVQPMLMQLREKFAQQLGEQPVRAARKRKK